MKKPEIIKNPLTLIAIFAGLSDIAMTTVLPLLPPETQKIFMWFVMGYPVLLACGFFYVLIWKREALYAPSDFKDDATWLKVLNEKQGKILSKYPLERAVSSQKDSNDAFSEDKDQRIWERNYFYKFLKSTGLTADDIRRVVLSVDSVDELPVKASKEASGMGISRGEISERIKGVLDKFPNSKDDFFKLKAIMK